MKFEPATDPLMKVGEAAAFYRVTEPTIHRWCRIGRLPAVRVGKAWLIPRPTSDLSLPAAAAASVAVASRESPLDSKLFGAAARGQHFLCVAASAAHAENLSERIRQRSQTRRIPALLVRIGDDGAAAEGSADVLLSPDDIENSEAGEMELVWRQAIAPLARQGRALCLIRQYAPANSAGAEALVRWERQIRRSVLGKAFTVLCLYDDASFQQLTAAERTRIMAAHAFISMESEDSQVLLARS
jgi:excisionase family DNA binding protein